MVQLLLIFGKRTFLRWGMGCAGMLLLSITPAFASKVHKEKTVEPAPPDLLLEGGRKLHWERTFSSEKEMEKRGFFGKLVDVVIGLRVTEEVETEGLDTAEHGERAYSL